MNNNSLLWGWVKTQAWKSLLLLFACIFVCLFVVVAVVVVVVVGGGGGGGGFRRVQCFRYLMLHLGLKNNRCSFRMSKSLA